VRVRTTGLGQVVLVTIFSEWTDRSSGDLKTLSTLLDVG
jgi:hypothetical protein